MKVESVLITGANRGIGLEFVRQFSKFDDPPKYIFATYRNAQTLQDLKDLQESSKKSRIVLIKMDSTVAEDIEAAKKVIEETVGDRGLNLLINNAGILNSLPFPNVTPENLEVQFKVNTVAPVMVLQTIFPLLEKVSKVSKVEGKRVSKAGVINMTSLKGGIQRTDGKSPEDFVVPGYKISKAALNMAMRVFALSVKDKDVLILNMCPGWVKTDMGTRKHGKIESEESIANMIETFPKLNESHHGSYIDRFANDYSY